MRQISIVSQKGGAGKTTLAVHLAGAATGAGYVSLTLRSPADLLRPRTERLRSGAQLLLADAARL